MGAPGSRQGRDPCQDAVRIAGQVRKARSRGEGQGQLGRNGAIERNLPDVPAPDEELIGRDVGEAGEKFNLPKDLGRVAVMSQKAEFDWQKAVTGG